MSILKIQRSFKQTGVVVALKGDLAEQRHGDLLNEVGI
jgi:hypothetical protein